MRNFKILGGTNAPGGETPGGTAPTVASDNSFMYLSLRSGVAAVRGNHRAVGVQNFLEVSCYLSVRAMTGWVGGGGEQPATPIPAHTLFHGLWPRL